MRRASLRGVSRESPKTSTVWGLPLATRGSPLFTTTKFSLGPTPFGTLGVAVSAAAGRRFMARRPVAEGTKT